MNAPKGLYYFLCVVPNPSSPKQIVLLWSWDTNQIVQRNFNFMNWFYTTDSKNEKKLNVLMSDGTRQDLLKVEFDTSLRGRSLFERFKKANQTIYEYNIPRHIKFACTYDYRFLDVINNDGERVDCDNHSKVSLYLVLRFQTNQVLCQKYDIVTSKEKVLQRRSDILQINLDQILSNNTKHLIVFWKNIPPIYRNSQTVFSFYNLCTRFLGLNKYKHEKYVKIPPIDYFYMNCGIDVNKKFDLIQKYFEKYMPEVIILTQMLCISPKQVFRRYSPKFLNDLIFLSRGDIVCQNPQDQPSYQSNPFIFLKEQGLFIGKIFGLDYDSFYPSIMIKLFENRPHLKPYRDALIEFLEKKRNSPLHKHIYKMIINPIYGCFGIKKASHQLWVRSCTRIAEEVCLVARKILERTKKFFEEHDLQPIYCNTDSIVLISDEIDPEEILRKWNQQNPHYILKMEFETSKMLLINKQVRIIDDKCFGWLFNSILLPPILRTYLRRICFDALQESETARQFLNYIEICEKQCSQPQLVSVEELLRVSNNAKKNGIRFFAVLYNHLNGSLHDVPFTKALSLVDSVEENILDHYKTIEQKHFRELKNLINKAI